jgi:hypothetical protein
MNFPRVNGSKTFFPNYLICILCKYVFDLEEKNPEISFFFKESYKNDYFSPKKKAES